MRWVACFLWLLWLATACVLEDRPIDMQGDGGNDAGLCGGCPDAEPVCTEDLECVQCTADDDGYCTARAQVCDTDSSTCVQCVGDSDCTAAGAGRCDAHECKPCNDHSQCSDIDGLPVGANACDDGLCVDCTPATEAQTCANDKSCDPRTRACTDTTVASLDTCEACVADSECGDNGAPSTAHRCVPMSYDGERFPNDETGFCLKIFSPGGCEQPYAIRIDDRESLSGVPNQSYCGINEALATCPAVRALDENRPCSPTAGDTDCPVSGLCRNVGGLPNGCTYRCSDETQCDTSPNPGSSCGSSGSGGGDYCGG